MANSCRAKLRDENGELLSRRLAQCLWSDADLFGFDSTADCLRKKSCGADRYGAFIPSE